MTRPKPPLSSSLRTPAVRRVASSSGDWSRSASVRYPPQRVAEVHLGRHRGDRVLAGVLAGERLDQQVDEVEHLDVAVAQRLRERVVLVLGAADPRDAVEEQLVVVARGQPLQLRSGPVEHHGLESADLGVGTVRGGHGWPHS